jgi:hypothetical protein
MKKGLSKTGTDDLRNEYDLTTLQGGVRGKYHDRATAGMNLVMIDPDLTDLFPNSEAVNRALRLLVEAARTATPAQERKR